MNTFHWRRLVLLFAMLLPAWGAIERTQAAVPASASDTPIAAAPGAPASSAAVPTDDSPAGDAPAHHRHRNSVVSIGHDSTLRAGEQADSVVSVLGNTRVSGSVKDSAVAVLGDTYVDSTVDGDAVAVLGNVELGPHAEIGGDVIAVGGTVKRDAASIVHGDISTVAGAVAGAAWLRPWIDHCLLYARPLALVAGIGWAWGLAIALWALYLCLALLFPKAVTDCVQTLERQPGKTTLAALLAVLLVPVLFVLLCITVVGLIAVPVLGLALLCVGLFGKAVVLAWLGRRCLGRQHTGPLGDPAFAVLLGGAIVLALYCVPVLGILIYKLLGLLGLGAVSYTLILAAQARRTSQADPTRSATAPVAGTASAAAEPETGSPAAAAAPAPAASSAESAASQVASPAASVAAEPVISAALPRAGFWIRILALLIDAILVGFLMGVLHHAFNFEMLVLAAYGAVMWKMRGSTIGGMVFDLRVVRVDGRPMDWETAVVRALGCFLSLAVAGLGFFWIAFDHGKQAWHDKIAGTAVVRVAKGVPLQG